jgi:nucleoside-diphosphate-sugar epimerase
VKYVVHLAARVHVMNESSEKPQALYDRVNEDGTLRLAHQAAASGVKRFVYLSTVKVHGECTSSTIQPSAPPYFHEGILPLPEDPYGMSKYHAEIGLRQIEKDSGMDVVILRPPLIYGPGVRANFLRLMQLVDSGFPLPFGSIKNKRSMLYVGNLVSAIYEATRHPNAAGHTFLVSDGTDVSTSDLIREMARHLGKRARLIPIPGRWLMALGRALGKREAMERILGSLVVDSTHLQKQLNWKPPFTFEEGIKKSIDWHLEQKKRSSASLKLSTEVAP